MFIDGFLNAYFIIQSERTVLAWAPIIQPVCPLANGHFGIYLPSLFIKIMLLAISLNLYKS